MVRSPTLHPILPLLVGTSTCSSSRSATNSPISQPTSIRPPIHPQIHNPPPLPQQFVQHFALLACPLTDLLKKGALFIWTPTHESAFQALKSALIQAPVLALPDFNKTFQLHTDASDRGVGTVLLQEGHPIAFVNKALGP